MRQLDERLLTRRLIEVYRSVLPNRETVAEKLAMVQAS
jgi:hypothetical protein